MRERRSTESRCRPPMVRTQANKASLYNGDLCGDARRLANNCRWNVMVGLIRKRITCLVRIKYFEAP